MAASSRSSLRAYNNDKIRNKGKRRRKAEMHNAGGRLQLIAPSVDPRKEGLARYARRSIAPGLHEHYCIYASNR